MDGWIRFDVHRPTQGQFIAAITQHDGDVPVDTWERDLEKNSVGTWIDGVVWEGNLPRSGFTHWLPLPDRPPAQLPAPQPDLWFRTLGGDLEPERRRRPRHLP
jgi:hypothetical protein